MLSQLPLASPVVPGERGRHLHRYRRQVAGRGGCVVVPTCYGTTKTVFVPC